MIWTAVVSILLLAFFSENCAGLNVVQIHINDTKRSPMMVQQQQQQQQHPFGRDYREFTLVRYLYGITGQPSVLSVRWSEFFEWRRIKREICIISREIAAHMAQNSVQVQPPITDVFNAFLKVNLWNMRVVILGQDPTPKPGEATGMAFSLKPTSDPTYVSTGNILKLLNKRGYRVNFANGDLTKWAKQGVLLLNSALTITVGNKPESDWHQRLWRRFTQLLISHISIDAKNQLVWMLWGNTAKSFRRLIDEQRHMVLKGCHPSPNNQYCSFIEENDFFEEANAFFDSIGQPRIDWNLV